MDYIIVYIHTSITETFFFEYVGRRATRIYFAGDREETLLLRPRGPHHDSTHNTST